MQGDQDSALWSWKASLLPLHAVTDRETLRWQIIDIRTIIAIRIGIRIGIRIEAQEMLNRAGQQEIGSEQVIRTRNIPVAFDARQSITRG